MSATPTVERPRGAVHAGLWIGQLLLAALFAMAGSFKTFTPIPELATQLPWVTDAPAAFVRFVGISELLGAVGLILPAALRVQPWLTSAAAAGLALVMACAVPFHLYRGDGASSVVTCLVIGSVAVAVAWGRRKLAPIPPR